MKTANDYTLERYGHLLVDSESIEDINTFRVLYRARMLPSYVIVLDLLARECELRLRRAETEPVTAKADDTRPTWPPLGPPVGPESEDH